MASGLSSEVHCGKDDLVRVETPKVYKHPVTKLAPLLVSCIVGAKINFPFPFLTQQENAPERIVT